MAGKKLDTTDSMEMATTTQNDIVDVDLSVVAKKKFRIDGDNDKIIELNTSDLNIINRIEETLQKLNKLSSEAGEIAIDADSDEDGIAKMSAALSDIDNKMKELIDYIFDSPVSDKCSGGGSMYDPFEGQFRWEHVLDRLMKLYEDNLKSEYKKMQTRMSKHTKKYMR